ALPALKDASRPVCRSSLPALDGVADEDHPAPRTRHCALDENELALGVRGNNLEVERRYLLRAHPAGHAGAAEDASRRCTSSNRAWGPVLLVVAVRAALPLEVVALHSAGETLALADRGDVDLVSNSQDSGVDLLADGVAARV